MQTPALFFKSCLNTLGIAFAGSIFLAFLSQLYIPLPFTPVPITLQTLGVFLLSALINPLASFLSIVFYLIEGTIGLPVFAGGVPKPLWYQSSTAGFLFSFLFITPLISWFFQKKSNISWTYLITLLSLAQLLIFVFGVGYLAYSIGWHKAYLIGMRPFILGAFVKIGLSTLLVKGILSKGIKQYG